MLTLLLSSLIALGGGPFAELDYESALAQAKKEQKLLLVDFTATWCGPCKMMEKNTWADEGVRGWLKANAIAVQVDIDKNPKLGRQYEIESIPAVVALLGGAELDRSVGYRDPARFLAWAKKLREAKPASTELLERAKNLKDSPDVQERYQL